MNKQIKTEEDLQVVLKAVEKYYRFNACMTKDSRKEKYITVAKLLNGAIGIASIDLLDSKTQQD